MLVDAYTQLNFFDGEDFFSNGSVAPKGKKKNNANRLNFHPIIVFVSFAVMLEPARSSDLIVGAGEGSITLQELLKHPSVCTSSH